MCKLTGVINPSTGPTFLTSHNTDVLDRTYI